MVTTLKKVRVVLLLSGLLMLDPGGLQTRSMLLAWGPLTTRGEGTEAQTLPSAIHPQLRHEVSPAKGQAVKVNPPILLWPLTSGKDVRYSVRLSSNPEFPREKTIEADGLRWGMFNPHQQLEPAKWYWKFRVDKGGETKGDWSSIFEFSVQKSARPNLTPSAQKVLSAAAVGHPRFPVTAAELVQLRKKLRGSRELARVIAASEKHFGEVLPDEESGKPSQSSSEELKAKKFATWAGKAFANELVEKAQASVWAYLLTEDTRHGREAIRRGLHVARLDPDGVTSSRVSDFADGACMRTLAWVYDGCYPLLSGEEKAELLKAMEVRASRFYDRQLNNLEGRVFNAHIWQHILLEFAEVAFASLGDLPVAEEWVTYVYELWLARFPLLGGDDGGWANGVSYFGSNFDTLLDLPDLLGKAAGVDLFQIPWYRNASLYQFYAWPQGSYSDGFGDGSEREELPSLSRALFMESLGRKTGSPLAVWYSRQIVPDWASESDGNQVLWRRIQWMLENDCPPSKGPTDLPLARVFRDVGLASMQTNLTEVKNNLMIGFRSSPYGAHNHMHADQNSFNLLFGGKRLFSNSGYYIAYGDDHFKEWYTATRGQNSVLIDGQGQLQNEKGFGWIPRFLDGRQISYCLGDASSAYGDAGLSKFRRHLVLLRPKIVLIYDELEADHPARWEWLLHSVAKITAGERGTLYGEVSGAKARVDLFGSELLNTVITSAFDPPAENWRGRTSGGEVVKYPDQWHVSASPEGKSQKARILAIIRVEAGVDSAKSVPSPVSAEGVIDLGEWTVRASLDPSQPASFLVERKDGRARLVVDRSVQDRSTNKVEGGPGRSVLVESDYSIRQVSQDELPEAAR